MAAPPMRSVFSSHVHSIGHDAETGDLHVRWDDGKTSIYEGVPREMADDVMNNWSVGKALRERVKPHFKHRYG